MFQAGSSRVLYDLLPVVSFRGWPAVAQGWLTANHFWDGKITEEEAISGFYLLPCCSPLGGRPDREWRLVFSRSEVRLLLLLRVLCAPAALTRLPWTRCS